MQLFNKIIKDRIIKANLAKFCQLIASLFVIQLQLKLTNFKLEVLKSA